MGNSTSHRRHLLYWGGILLLSLPPSASGWNIPFFGGVSHPSITPSVTPSVDDPLRVDGSPAPSDLDARSTDDGSPVPVGIPRLSTVAAPIIYGPADAPHLRMIPSYFSNQIPTKVKQLLPSIISAFHKARLKAYHFLWYKPPVGIVGAWSALRILEKVYGLFSPPPPTSGAAALADAEGKLRGSLRSLFPSKASVLNPWGSLGRLYTTNLQKQQLQKRRRKRRRKVRKGRSFDLDRGDRSYDNYGGIETVRVRACQEGLRAALAVASPVAEAPLSMDDGEEQKPRRGLFGMLNGAGPTGSATGDGELGEYTADIDAALGALQLSCPPRGSREYFVEQSADALSALCKYIEPSNAKDRGKDAPGSIDEQNVQLLLQYSSKLIELRSLDALLRTLRDRHLIVSARLRRTREYWKWHVNLSGGWLGRLMLRTRQKIMKALPSWGSWMGYDFRDRNQREYELATATLERELVWLGKVERLLLDRPEEMEAGELLSVVDDGSQRAAHWWNGLVGSGQDQNGADPKPIMSDSVRLLLKSRNRRWIRQTEEWNRAAREIIRDSLDETISSTFTSIEEADGSGESKKVVPGSSGTHFESRFLEQWATYDDEASGAYSWLAVLSLVDSAASPRRAGERRHIELSGITARIKRYDILGIPSSMLLLAGANSLHDKVIAPHKAEIVEFVKGTYNAVYGIVEFRFYEPIKGITLDLLNRRPRMVDPFALLNEQTSLDNMLKDLGVGDGTEQTRAAALASASRMYEQEVAGGAIRGIVRGKVAQLMLIQIQQLKADLLQAMDAIDSLVDSNRLNVQLIAAIPAVLILVYGTRALFLFWSNIRMQDFRLPHDVHSEMSDYLKKVEECLVLSNYQLDASAEESASIVRPESCLGSKDMGVLLLWLHSYLNLLDYMSPPFPSKQCDSIHQSVQNLLMQGQMSTTRQLELLKVIQEKHADLLKSL
ncbi:hypothetical protein ACHAXT_008633 [Thalassiosira profunda]